MLDINSALCCFNYFNAYTIELLIIIFVFIGITGIWCCSSFVSWYSTSYFLKITYIILEFYLFIFDLIFLSPIIFYRIKNVINLKKNRLGRYYSIACIFSSLLGFIINILFMIIVLINMKKQKINKKKISNIDWMKTIASFIILLVIWLVLILLSLSDLLRLNLKINTTYKTFLHAINKEATISEMIKHEPKTIKINNEKTPSKNNNNVDNNEGMKKFNDNGVINEINEVIINPLDKKFA